MSNTDPITIEAVRSLARRKQIHQDTTNARAAKKIVDRIFQQLAKANFDVENEDTLRVTVWTPGTDSTVKERACRQLEQYGFAHVFTAYSDPCDNPFSELRTTFRLIMPKR